MKTEKWSGVVKRTAPQVVSRVNGFSPRKVTWVLLSVLVLMVTAPMFAGAAGIGGKPGVGVMNVNLYVGGDPGRVMALDPTDPAYASNLVVAVTGVFYEILGSQPGSRLQGAANEIAARMPELVSVEEATLLREQSPGDLMFGGTTPATNVVADYLQILVAALEARGAHYAVASAVDGMDVELPMMNLQTGSIDDARLTYRNAILVRTDLPPGQFRVTNPQSGQFSAALQLPALGLSFPRGWCSVDANVCGQALRFVCAHTEEETSPQIQLAQVLELLAGPVRTRLPVIVAGDFNADPLHRTGTPTYDAFRTADLKDAWNVTHPRSRAGGLTWGHDESLADPTLAFVWRLDLVLYRGYELTPLRMDVVDMELDRTEPPLWASDHAAVSARFQLLRGKPSGNCNHGDR